MSGQPFSDQAVAIFRTQLEEMRPRLAALRESALNWGMHSDWPWNGFVLSHATLGGSANWEQRIGPAYEALYAWGVLTALSSEERAARFGDLGNPRYRQRICRWVTSTSTRIASAGGPAATRRDYAACDTAKARIAFVRSFAGFDEKYGRNILMDCYDDLVRNHFALDHRLKAALADCGHPGVTYRRGEAILRQLAEQLEVDEIRAALTSGDGVIAA
jgi:hypothetical protein